MNILMHTVYYLPEVGGLENHVHYLCRELHRRGHQVKVVTSASLPGLGSHDHVDGVEVWRTWLPARNTVGWAAHSFASLPRFLRLAREADILHAQDIGAVLPALIARSMTGAPVVTTYHTSHFRRRASSPFWRRVFRKFLRAADHNLAASEEMARLGQEIAPGVSIEAQTNGVDTEFFRPLPAEAAGHDRDRPYRLVVVSRLLKKKGVEYFVRAMPLILTQVPVEAVVIGDGPERTRLEALSRDLGISDRVTFLGARPHSEMPGLLAACDLAVLPSLGEATSIAALEAMACELPVAATNVGGLPQIVDDGVGGLCEAANPRDLSRLVTGLLAGGRLRELGAEARRRVVGHWSNDRLADRHEALYRELLAGRARSRRTEN